MLAYNQTRFAADLTLVRVVAVPAGDSTGLLRPNSLKGETSIMNIKGTGWIAMKKYFDETYGRKDLMKLKAALDEETRALFEKENVLPMTWMDYGAYMKILLTADKVLGRGDFEIVKQANYYGARQDIKGVYKIIVSLVSPKTAISAASKLIKQYYDKGTLFLENVTPKSVTIILEGVDDIPLYHDIENGSYGAEVLRMAGAKNVTVTHPQCMARGDSRCRFDVTWE
jgi:hypothetical protein